MKEQIEKYLLNVEKRISNEVESARDPKNNGILASSANKQKYLSVLQSTRKPFEESKVSAALS